MRSHPNSLPRAGRLLALAVSVMVAGLNLAQALTFSEWQSVNFTSAQLANSAVSAPTADPDGDGLLNLQEFVFGSNPWSSGSQAGTTPVFVNGKLGLVYREAHNLTEAGIWLQGTDNLVNWATFNERNEVTRQIGTSVDTVTLLEPLSLGFTESLRRFLRLKLQLGELPRLPPLNPSAVINASRVVDIRWSDPNGYEYGYWVERQNRNGQWVALANLPNDSTQCLDIGASVTTGYTYRVTLLDDGDPVLQTAPFSVLDSDEDGIPDALELGNNYTGVAGTYPSYAWLSDSDGDQIPDLWEAKYGFDTRSALDATLDSDGDGLSNLEEFLANSDPTDFYNGITPTLFVVSGQDQMAPPGDYLPEPIIVAILKPDGSKWINAPVQFSAANEQAVLAQTAETTAPTAANMTFRTDSEGLARVYWKVATP